MTRSQHPHPADSPAPADSSPTHTHRTQLWFEQFRDLAFNSRTQAGGALTMLGTVFAAAPGRRVGFIALAWFVAGAFAVLSMTR